jgi:hypothetical protein
VGGEAALAEIGDFVLENDQVRVAILQPGNSVGPGVFGGSLIDADLNRPQMKYQAGKGNDQFAEMFPSVNLLVPNPSWSQVRTGPDWDGPPGDPPDDGCPAVWPEDEQGNPLPKKEFAAVCAAGVGDNYLEALSLLGVFIGEASFQTDYVLRNGKRYVDVLTVIDAGDGDRSVIRPMCPFRRDEELGHEPLSVLAAIVGTDDYAPGLLTGDFLLFGRRLHVFVPGLGFNEGSYIQELFLSGADTLNRPVSFPYMAGVGDKVSYALISDRTRVDDPWGVCGENQDEPPKLLVPVETGSFTFVFTNWWRCPADVAGCQDGGKLSYKRYFIIGEGDVASLTDQAYKIWDIPTGTLAGGTYDGITGKPVPDTDVYVLRDPVASEWADHYPHADIAVCNALRGEQGDAVSFQLVEGCARNASVTPDYELGQLGVVNHIRTDRGDDPVKDGRFKAKLPPGTYYVVGYQEGRGPSDAQRVVIKEGKRTGVGVPLLAEGKVLFDVRNEQGERIPTKITIIGDCKDAQGNDVCDCFPVTDPECKGDGLPESGRQILEFGGFRAKEGVVRYVHSATGHGEITVPPGRYRFVFSRGAEHTIDEHVRVVPDDGRAISIHAALQRVVDSTGWISGDFHVHGRNSYDAVPGYEERITSFLVEGMELLSSSDHDWVTDYEPYVRQMGVEKWVKTQVGLEVTPVEIGHFLGWPVVFNDNMPENGAIDWTGLTPQQIFTAIRDMGEYGPEDTVVTVAHPRDSFFGYFDQFGMSPFDLTLEIGYMQSPNPILSDTGNFHPGADAVEMINGKRYDMIRTPTNEEVRKFNLCMEYRKGHLEELPEDFLEGECELSWSSDYTRSYWARRVLTRTPAESAAYRYDMDGERECRTDQDCADLGLVDSFCNRNTGMCAAPAACSAPGECDAGQCNLGEGQCYLGSVCDPSEDVPDCGSGLVCEPGVERCVEPCRGHLDCHPELRCCKTEDCGCVNEVCREASGNDDGAGVCVEAKCDVNAAWEMSGEGASRPCIDWQGNMEDWFRLLNHGVNFTGLGHSDTHTLTKNEPGMCHNLICSSVDEPSHIDPLEIARNLKNGCVVASYGPMLELWVNGERVGSKVKAPASSEIAVRVRVQSPAWFDVDRVEVYRNGSLRWIFEANEAGEECNGPYTEWPCQIDEPVPGFQVRRCECIPTEDGHNTDVVNMDVTFGDNPQKDAWYVAVAMASSMKARTMSPIQSWRYYPNMSFGIIVNKALGAIDLGIDIASFVEPTPTTAQVSPVIPYAVTNPIWVDRDNADEEPFSFTAPGPFPRWMSNFHKSRTRAPNTPAPGDSAAEASPAASTGSNTGANTGSNTGANTGSNSPTKGAFSSMRRHPAGNVKRQRRRDVRAFLQDGLNRHLLRAVKRKLERKAKNRRR